VHLRSTLVLLVLGPLAWLGCERKQAPAPVSEARPTATASTGGPLLIGFVGALTGAEAHYGAESRNGALLAVEEANAAGGVQGRLLALRAYDSQSRPEEAASAMTRLATQDGVLFVVGENQSTNSLAMAPAATQAQVPMISPSSTNPRVTSEGGPWVFRVCFTDTFQGRLLARFARETLKADRVATMIDQKSDYSIGLAKVFATKFTALGGTIVAEEYYTRGDTDFRGPLTRVKAVRPQVLFIPGYYSDAGPLARQARELGIQATLLGGDGWDRRRCGRGRALLVALRRGQPRKPGTGLPRQVQGAVRARAGCARSAGVRRRPGGHRRAPALGWSGRADAPRADCPDPRLRRNHRANHPRARARRREAGGDGEARERGAAFLCGGVALTSGGPAAA